MRRLQAYGISLSVSTEACLLKQWSWCQAGRWGNALPAWSCLTLLLSLSDRKLRCMHTATLHLHIEQRGAPW